jgi:hypothetical protein
VKKLFDAKIIVPIRFSNWLANLVPVRKKNGEIRICIDFRNLNKASLKDNYPLPKMDLMLQNIVGSQRMSMLDGFSGYNQILVHPEDQEKTAFTTPWGTFMYAKMPFGLMNAGATFQRAMDIAFAEEKDKSVVVYLDDITVFSKREEDHLKHLEKILLKCRRFGISLNPTKSIFALTSGKLLGHIISQEGIRIDPNRVSAISKLDLPRSKKEVQSFLGKVNFVRRFIPNFAEVVKHITKMLKKGADFKWTAEARKSFEEIKKALTQAPVLISPDFTKEFLIFTYASEDTIAGVLLQKGNQGTEQPISFFSKTLANAELKYNILEKQAYALVKAIKDFRIYVLHSHIVAYVPSAVIKDILTQADPDGKRGKWIAKLLEYDIEIRPTKLVKGQGLAELLTHSNLDSSDINFNAEISEIFEEEEELVQINEKFLISEWYKDVSFVLQHNRAPDNLSKSKARFTKLKSLRYFVYEQNLFWKDAGGILLSCLIEEEADRVIDEFHKGDCGGHHYWKATANKILRAGYFWPTMFKDIYKKVAACHECQLFEGKRKLMPMPLVPIYVEAPFQQWGLDFIGEIHPSSSGQHRWILTATDYFTKWIEAVPTRQANDAVIISFLENNILSRFGCPLKLITDNAQAFKSKRMINFCHQYHISLGHSTAYYPQGNGLAESSNKSLVRIIKKLLQENKKTWHLKLKYALWADRICTKRSIGTSPYELVYGAEAIFPTSLGVPVMKLIQGLEEEPNAIQRRINQLIALQEKRNEVVEDYQQNQNRVKRAFDKKIKDVTFQIDDKVLKWEAKIEEKGKHGKFENLWKGPYLISAFHGNNTYILQEVDGSQYAGGPVNGRFLKHYYQ